MTKINAIFVFQVDSTNEDLIEIIEDLEEMDGLCFEKKIRKDERASDLYLIIDDDEHSEARRVRVVENQIWCGSYSGTIETALRIKDLPYKLGTITTSEQRFMSPNPKPLNLNERNTEVTYTPKKR